MASGFGNSSMNRSGDVILPHYAGTQRIARVQKMSIGCCVDLSAFESFPQGERLPGTNGRFGGLAQWQGHEDFVLVAVRKPESFNPTPNFLPTARFVEALKAHTRAQFKVQLFKSEVLGGCPFHLGHERPPDPAFPKAESSLDAQHSCPVRCELVCIASQEQPPGQLPVDSGPQKPIGQLVKRFNHGIK